MNPLTHILTLKRSSTFLMNGYKQARITANAIKTHSRMSVCFGIISLLAGKCGA